MKVMSITIILTAIRVTISRGRISRKELVGDVFAKNANASTKILNVI